MSDLPSQLRKFGYQETEEAADYIEHLERVLLLAKMALEYHTQQTRPIHGTAQTIAAIDEALKS